MLADCTKCSAALPEELFTGSGDGVCPRCNSKYHVRAFPAIAQSAAALSVQELQLAEGEASCFQHEGKKAVAACGNCGRFVCALCRMEAEGAVWCPVCLFSGIAKHNVSTLETQRTLYDSVALGLAALPLIIFYLSIFTGPIAVFLAIRYWNRPSSLVPRSKWRLVVALVLGILETAGLVALIVFGIWILGRRNTR